MMSLPNLLQKQKALEVLSKLKEVVAVHPFDPDHFRNNYKLKPITLVKTYQPKIKWPKKFRWIFAQIWLGKAGKKVIIGGPRGGGKSVLLGALGFCLWFLRKKSIVDMGGSLAQAKIVYSNFSSIVFSDQNILDTCAKDPLMESTASKAGNYFKAVPASPKSVRGPHPDVLMLDEACEAKDEIINDALPMVTSSDDPLTIITSTFHKVFGVYQEIWDNADELGFTRFKWNIFDVCKTFDPSIWKNPALIKLIPDLYKLEKLAAGNTGDPEGWVRIENIISAWQGKPSIDWFLVEFMGSRPSASGLINDPEDVEACIFDEEIEKQYTYVEGSMCVLGIDWGFSSMTAVVEFMGYKDQKKIQLDCRTYSQVLSDTIIDDVVEIVKAHNILYIYADSAGKFENAALQSKLKKERLKTKVIEVVFGSVKDEMLGNYRAHWQRRLLLIPKKHKTAKWQHKRYRYAKGSDKPMKKDDHIPDASMCALSHPAWKLDFTPPKVSDIQLSNPEILRTISAGLMNERF
jgi:hypothetical protein